MIQKDNFIAIRGRLQEISGNERWHGRGCIQQVKREAQASSRRKRMWLCSRNGLPPRLTRKKRFKNSELRSWNSSWEVYTYQRSSYILLWSPYIYEYPLSCSGVRWLYSSSSFSRNQQLLFSLFLVRVNFLPVKTFANLFHYLQIVEYQTFI